MTDARERLDEGLAVLRFETSGRPGTMNADSGVRAARVCIEALRDLLPPPAQAPVPAALESLAKVGGSGNRFPHAQAEAPAPDVGGFECVEVVHHKLGPAFPAKTEAPAVAAGDLPPLGVEPVTPGDARCALAHLIHGAPYPPGHDPESALRTFIDSAEMHAATAEREVQRAIKLRNDAQGTAECAERDSAETRKAYGKLVTEHEREVAELRGKLDRIRRIHESPAEDNADTLDAIGAVLMVTP